jgi:hypothetical protein
VDSGGGYQAFWLLEEPFVVDGEPARAEEIERFNQQLAALFGGDNCHNIDRVMRLPDTVNLPNKTKRDQGRVEAPTKLVEANWDRTYTLADFRPAPQPGAPGPSKGATAPARPLFAEDLDLSALEERDREKVRALIRQGLTPEHSFGGDRSAAVWFVACAMVRAGCSDEEIVGVLTNEENGLHAHIHDARRSPGARLDYTWRQVQRARVCVESEFELNGKGKPQSSQHNIRAALAKLGVEASYDRFAHRMLVSGLLGFELLNDDAMDRLWLETDARFRFRPSKDLFRTVVKDLALQNAFHPVLDFLEGLEWDGEPRLDCWLVTYGGAEDSEYVRTVAAIVLIAAVRRIRRPGCKFDEMMVLESPQGWLKSTALAVLAVEDDWFTDDLPLHADTKRFIEATVGKWIVEAGELRGMRKAEIGALKSSLSRRVDRARMAYDRRPNEFPRQFIVIGTTNDREYLKDMTGNRRFWPVAVEKLDIEALRLDRDQLWAEAAAREAEGEDIRLPPGLWPAAAEAQDERRVDDPWETVILDQIFADQVLLGRDGDEVVVPCGRIFDMLNLPREKREQYHQERVGAVMRRLGFERRKRRIDGRSRWCYVALRDALDQPDVPPF